VITRSEEETKREAALLARRLRTGDVIFLEGPLGAGKTTFVRGVLETLGYHGLVRSPTFNLLQTFPTKPPVMHADLYRVASWHGIGLEDYLESHVCLIEWPDRAEGLVPPEEAWNVRIDFADEGRNLTLTPPSPHSG
jgi:tRNA threonylcarbamoyladenosine biosynthesis protein TsaE